jgi:hypothetical protein
VSVTPRVPSLHRTMLRRLPLRRPLSLVVRSLSSDAAYAVTPYRQLLDATAAQREAWAAEDVALHARMAEYVPSALKHNGEEYAAAPSSSLSPSRTHVAPGLTQGV